MGDVNLSYIIEAHCRQHPCTQVNILLTLLHIHISHRHPSAQTGAGTHHRLLNVELGELPLQLEHFLLRHDCKVCGLESSLFIPQTAKSTQLPRTARVSAVPEHSAQYSHPMLGVSFVYLMCSLCPNHPVYFLQNERMTHCW